MNDYFRITTDAQGIATLVLDRAGHSMNLIDSACVEQLDAAIGQLAGDAAVRGVILTSGKEAFLAGADLNELVALYDSGLDRATLAQRAGRYSAVLRRMETCGKPFAAALNGTALGGGLELALACHHRVLADDCGAVVGLPEVQLGLLPGAGGTQRLPRLIGLQPALELMTEGTRLRPDKALALGVVHALAPRAEVIASARRWLLETAQAVQPWDQKQFRFPGGAGALHPGAQQVFSVGTALVSARTSHNYPAPLAILSCVYEGMTVPFDTALRIESRYFTRLLQGPVYRNMTRTLFIARKAADKLARRPGGVPPSRVTRLGLLGAGMMGAGIAHVSAAAGLDVVLLDATPERAATGKAVSQGLLRKRVGQGRMSEAAMAAQLARIRPGIDYNELAGCELVIEAVFEDRGIKAEVTRKAEAVVAPTAIFASNTSTLPISGLAQAARRPAQFIGLHFFSPVERMPLVEVIRGRETADECLARALDYVRQIGKTPIVVNDSRGFYTSRVFTTYANEGMALLQEGVAPALIENAGRLAGMPVGPLAVHDEVSLELTAKVHRQTCADLGDDYRGPSAIDVALRLVELGRLGRKAGKGFYDYPAAGAPDARKRLWSGLAELYPRAATQPALDTVKKRLLYIQALESWRCLEEGVIEEPAEADIGSILGWGYPAWTGGTLSLIDTVGVKAFVAACDRFAATCGARFTVPDSLRER